MTIFDAILLGIVQGLSEFLPISSSGHLIILHDWLGVTEGGFAFDAVLQFATALAVAMYFWRDIAAIVRGVPHVFTGCFTTPEARILIAVFSATVPGVVLGIVLQPVMETLFRSPILVACALILGSGTILYAERHDKNRDRAATAHETPTPTKSFLIGIFQALALIPGMSRSGMTLSGGMLLGLSREAATRFSFLIGSVILLGAGAKETIAIARGSMAADGLSFSVYVAGAIASFVVGLAVIHYFLRFVRTHSLIPFVYYRLAIALLVLVLAFGGSL
jgi:undecaprenyl-diphosphatase